MSMKKKSIEYKRKAGVPIKGAQGVEPRLKLWEIWKF